MHRSIVARLQGSSYQHVKKIDVVDADGIPIEVGDTVYDINTGGKWEVVRFKNYEGEINVVLDIENEFIFTLEPCKLLHRKPARDAHCTPINVGDIIYDMQYLREFKVTAIKDERIYGTMDGEKVEGDAENFIHVLPKIRTANDDQINIGDTLYRVDTGEKVQVEEFRAPSGITDKNGWQFIDQNGYLQKPGEYTSVKTDSQERINADVLVMQHEYWGCTGKSCFDDCPALIDGKKPKDYYDVPNCRDAMVRDLLRRQKTLDGRENEE